MSDKLESVIQLEIIKDLKLLFPDSIILKNDAQYIQGFPDLTVLLNNGLTVILEVKRNSTASYQPNQKYYLEYCKSVLGYMTYAIYPENKKEIYHEIQQAYKLRG